MASSTPNDDWFQNAAAAQIRSERFERAGWARNHGFSLKDVFSMKHRHADVFRPPAPDVVFPLRQACCVRDSKFW